MDWPIKLKLLELASPFTLKHFWKFHQNLIMFFIGADLNRNFTLLSMLTTLNCGIQFFVMLFLRTNVIILNGFNTNVAKDKKSFISLFYLHIFETKNPSIFILNMIKNSFIFSVWRIKFWKIIYLIFIKRNVYSVAILQTELIHLSLCFILKHSEDKVSP